MTFIWCVELAKESIVSIILPLDRGRLRSLTLTHLPPAARTSARLPGRTTSKQTPSVIRLLKTRANGWKITDCLAGIPNSSSFSSICMTSSTNGRIFWASCCETFSTFGMIVSTQSSALVSEGKKYLTPPVVPYLSRPTPRARQPHSCEDPSSAASFYAAKQITLAPSASRSRMDVVLCLCVREQPPQLDELFSIRACHKLKRKPTLGMGDVYFVSFSQLRESAETRFDYSDSFRRGSRRPVFNVGSYNVEKRHLIHSIFVSGVGQHRD